MTVQSFTTSAIYIYIYISQLTNVGSYHGGRGNGDSSH